MDEEKKPKHLFKRHITIFIILAVLFIVSEYFTLTPINLHSVVFLETIAIFLGLYMILRLILIHKFGKPGIFAIIGIVLSLAVSQLGPFFAQEFFSAKQYASQLSLVKTDDFYTDMDRVTSNSIPVVDKASARKLGDKKIGSVSEDYISQFNVANTYEQINYKGKAYRVTMLKYDGRLKWFTNHFSGIPAYITVDMITQDTQVVTLKEPMKYTAYDKLFRNIKRHIRLHYPTLMFDKPSFELDEEGTPYYVAPVYTYKIGFFGGKEVTGVVIVNAVTGKCKYYQIGKIPEWVDRVYPADLLMEQLSNYGKYTKGYLNTLLTQKNVLQPSSGYNYLAIDKDIYLYTGLTSVSNDSSNVGIALINMRTKDAKFYPISGATEDSARKSAEGKVQELGYKGTFPILLNIDNVPTYFLSLKDNEGLVKKYAFVSVENYEIVGTGDTVESARQNYLTIIKETGHNKIHRKLQKVKGTITSIKEVVVEGNTTYYLTINKDNHIFVAPVTVNPQLPMLEEGDIIQIQYIEGFEDEKTLDIQSLKVIES